MSEKSNPSSFNSDYGVTPRLNRTNSQCIIPRRLFQEQTPLRPTTPLLDKSFAPEPNTPLGDVSFRSYAHLNSSTPFHSVYRTPAPSFLDITSDVSMNFASRNSSMVDDLRVHEPSFVATECEVVFGEIRQQIQNLSNAINEKNETSSAFARCLEDLASLKPTEGTLSAIQVMMERNQKLIGEVNDHFAQVKALQMVLEIDSEL